MSDLIRNSHCIGCGSKLRASDNKDYHDEDCFQRYLKKYEKEVSRFIDMGNGD